jgi:hypothetical protein
MHQTSYERFDAADPGALHREPVHEAERIWVEVSEEERPVAIYREHTEHAGYDAR